MPSWKKVITSGSDAVLNSLVVTSSIYVTGPVTASVFSGSSFIGSHTGSLLGTASYVTGSIHVAGNLATSASYAITSSFAATASFVNNAAFLSVGNVTVGNLARFYTATTIGNSNLFDDANGTIQITGSNIVFSGSNAQVRVSGSVNSTSGFTSTVGGFTGSLIGTASYVTGSIHTGANIAASASYAVSWSQWGGSLSTYIPVWTGTALSSSAMRDTGGQIRVAQNLTIDQGGLSVLNGGITSSNGYGLSISGPSQLNGNTSVTGSLVVSSSTLAVNTQQNATVNTGTSVIATLPTASMYAAFFDYIARSGSATQNMRAGTVVSVWNTIGSVQYTDNSTPDIGDTSGVTFAVAANASNIELRATVTTDSWNIKTFVRSI